MQQRSDEKILFPLNWANSCCSHPLAEGALFLGQTITVRTVHFTAFACPNLGKLAHNLVVPGGRVRPTGRPEPSRQRGGSSSRSWASIRPSCRPSVFRRVTRLRLSSTFESASSLATTDMRGVHGVAHCSL